MVTQVPDFLPLPTSESIALLRSPAKTPIGPANDLAGMAQLGPTLRYQRSEASVSTIKLVPFPPAHLS
jgi:hypothetical protein